MMNVVINMFPYIYSFIDFTSSELSFFTAVTIIIFCGYLPGAYTPQDIELYT